ncbi:hypothetical protein SALWKB12_1474 [Snodgrassella communis]|uniref:hypothetical protein n=1 Tax=Snodgrassella communis TaxID=2946699 RepID=UPI000461237B|nr:hypothetical protein [Snodgrassella communis]KDN12386.1 hypothetical protein SALWKB12_1474 [Snodgrassella communis]
MLKNTIILAMPSYSDFATAIKNHLEYHDFKVTFIDGTPEKLKKNIDANFRYPSLKSHLIHTARKILLSDYSYKTHLKEQIYNQKLQENMQSILGSNFYDYTLVIRPDLFPLPALQLLKKHTKTKFIGYQWNGIKRFPKTIPTIGLFDRFFVFDPMDLNNPEYSQYQLNGISNFYFDKHLPQAIPHSNSIAYFVGLHVDSRITTIEACANALIQNGVNLNFNIKFRPSEAYKTTLYSCRQINAIPENITFEDNLQHINMADILIDIINPVHNGLSFRIFEALYYKKKLITNNTQIKNYDFYHPDNILIWNKTEDLQQITDFLAKPLVSINPDIIQKYSFGNWIRNILNKPPFQPISIIY